MVQGETWDGRHRLVGVVFAASSPFEADLVAELYAAADAAGYRLALGLHGAERTRARACADLADQGCAAIIVVGAEHGDRYVCDVPIVVVGERIPDLVAVTVGTDEWRGAQMAVQHLIDLGHTSIAHIEGGDHPCAAERLRGYLGAMTAAGYRDECRTLVGDYTEEAGALAAERLLAEGNLPTAVFLANDRMAVGFIDVMRHNGVRVPEDMSVVGYDDGPHMVLGHVNLTTIRQDVTGLGLAAVDAVASLLGDSGQPANTGGLGFYGAIALEPELMVRGTTGPPAGADPRTDTGRERVRWGLLADTCDDALVRELGTPGVVSGAIEVVASASTAVAWEIADRLGILVSYGLYEDLIDDPEIDAIYIALPADAQEVWAIKAREAGKLVRCAPVE
ncbi:substrate-binding domain-containing protein [Gordonia sp. SID5947]|uniref:LacI family DNA-binding transcriptional regulator n=1 Tax=Gordonia sp. SID5947 TaxID=2690315 RepID=UPI00136D9470|nr:substrate-binding domain-containing protein [Gordonia sp. SID5947]MYR08869.1 substrate-binding domain-containing protein [Gordonia sp. SID5947]